MKSYNFNGDLYKKSSIYQKEWGRNLINSLSLKEDSNILDLGCGDGVLTYELSTLVPKGNVIGIDSSYGMLITANKYKKDNLYFKRMDINNLKFDIKFDVIYSNAALHWIKDHKSILTNCYNLLNPKGSINFNFASEGTCTNFNKIAKNLITEAPYKNYFINFEWPWYMPTVSEYEKLLKDINLYSEVNVFLEIADKFFPNKESLINWIDQPTLVPFLQVLPENLKTSFRNRVIAEMLNSCLKADGRCFETFRRINVHCKK